jgi:phytoene dehydrogenase-like protein
MGDADVVVVGAGLAGLACARALHRAGRDVVVLEASDAVGGRVRTDEVDGFRLDRGFQVMLTGYPELRANVDLAALDPRSFSPGVTIRRGGRFHRLADPTREPASAPGALRLATPLDGLRLLAWRRRLLRTPGPTLATAPQASTAELLAGRGFSSGLVAGFFRPFLSGTFFDPRLSTSSRLTELVFRSFLRGEVAVPAHGMQRLPEQVASALPADRVRTATPVEAVEPGVAHTADGPLRADAVVVATEAPAAARLLAGRAEVRTTDRAATTVHYAADASPVGGPDLVLGADDDGPVTTVAVMSDVAPDYAPPGRHLVSVALTGVPDDDDETLDRRVRAQLRAWWGSPVDAWSPLRIDRIPYAQPRMDPADLPTLRRPVHVEPGLWVCGDHRDTASLQGAMVSGRRTAEELLAA